MQTSIDNIYSILNEKGFVCLGHGTGRAKDTDDIIQLIFQNGLRTKDNSLYYTTVGLNTTDIDSLKQTLSHWPHLDSKKIILIRIPVEYINLLGNTADLEGERFGAFYNEKTSTGKTTYYLDPKFIVGYYDVESENVIINKNFEEKLSEQTIKTLREKYKKVLEKTKQRLQSEETIETPFASTEANSNEQEVPSLTYDLNDFDDDIEWEEPKDNKSNLP